jgi:hypothetical protein
MKALVYRLLGGCRYADFPTDDCRYWVRKYGLLPCVNCKRRWSL